MLVKAFSPFFKTVLIVFFFATKLMGQEVENDSIKKYYVPKSVGIQFAGNVGMFSFGSTWSFYKDYIALTPSFGYVPKLFAEKGISIAGIKVMYSAKKNTY